MTRVEQFKNLHLSWRSSVKDLAALDPLSDRLKRRSYDLAARNDRAFARLSEDDKQRVRKWLEALNRRKPIHGC